MPEHHTHEQLAFQQGVAQFNHLHLLLTELGKLEFGLRSIFKPPSERPANVQSHLQELTAFHEKAISWKALPEPIEFLVAYQQNLLACLDGCKSLIAIFCDYLKITDSFPSLSVKVETGAMPMLEEKHLQVKVKLDEFSSIIRQIRKLDIEAEGTLHYLKAIASSLSDEMAQEYAKCQFENKRLKL